VVARRARDAQMLKLSDNPPMLHPSVASVRDLAGRWWVAHTRARFEKAFAWDLLRRKIGYYLPLLERVRISSGKKRRVLMPIFPSYVFFCGDEDSRQAALTTNRICQAIYVGNQEQMIDELSAIEKALAGKAELDPYPFAAEGRCCRVKAGPFQGLEGVVVHRANVTRLVLQVSILGQGAAMEIDADLLEGID
jgi:transcription antitermination factor NusG